MHAVSYPQYSRKVERTLTVQGLEEQDITMLEEQMRSGKEETQGTSGIKEAKEKEQHTARTLEKALSRTKVKRSIVITCSCIVDDIPSYGA